MKLENLSIVIYIDENQVKIQIGLMRCNEPSYNMKHHTTIPDPIFLFNTGEAEKTKTSYFALHFIAPLHSIHVKNEYSFQIQSVKIS